MSRLPTGTWVSLPIDVIHGATPGPTVWLSSTLHGDELNGIPIIRRVMKILNPKDFRGTIIAVPVVNVFGFLFSSRYLPDRRDLNRSFPGSPRGSLASQLAHLFMTTVVKRCDFGIDLHTGSNGRSNLPQVRCDLDDPETRDLALHFGAPITIHANLRDGSLRSAVRKLGIGILLYETGEPQRFDSHGIRIGVEGVMRVLKRMGMTDDASEPPPSLVSRKTGWVRARRAGLCEMRVELGQAVTKGQTVAVVDDTLGVSESTVRADRNGIVVGQVTDPTINRGEAVAHIAEIDGSMEIPNTSESF